MKTVLVTGASGFVGGHIVRHLAAQGHRVFATEHSTRISDQIRACCQTILLDADTLNPRHFLSTLRHCDAVIHAAALVPSDMGDIICAGICFQENAMATLAMAMAASSTAAGRAQDIGVDRSAARTGAECPTLARGCTRFGGATAIR